MKLVFCGTPPFAVPTLEALLRAGHVVALVLTQPDRPSGRGMQITESPVKQAAGAAGIAVEQPLKLKNNDLLQAQLTAIAPEAIVVVAYGRIIPAWMLELPAHGVLNLHGSLLPRYRGAAPIQWAVARGEGVTGVTTMRIDAGLDTGDMLLQREVPIGDEQTAADLYPLLAQIGAGLMIETLEGLAAGSLLARPQRNDQATLAPILTREDGRIDCQRTAQETYNRWRGFYPWPGAWGILAGRKLSITRLALAPTVDSHAEPGHLFAEAGRFYLACAGGTTVELLEVQLEGKRSMGAAEFLRGNAALARGGRLD